MRSLHFGRGDSFLIRLNAAGAPENLSLRFRPFALELRSPLFRVAPTSGEDGEDWGSFQPIISGEL